MAGCLYSLQLVQAAAELRGPLGDAMLERFGEMAQFRLRTFLGREVSADGRNIHRLRGTGMVDAEPVDQKRQRPAGPEVAKDQLAVPAARS